MVFNRVPAALPSGRAALNVLATIYRMYHFEIVGHRGALRQAPENTLLSFRRAIDIGVDWVEFDLHESRDGVLVVIHDDRVDRTTDGRGKVSDMTFEEL